MIQLLAKLPAGTFHESLDRFHEDDGKQFGRPAASDDCVLSLTW